MALALSLSGAPQGLRLQEAPCGPSRKILTKTLCLQVSLGGGPRGGPFGARPGARPRPFVGEKAGLRGTPSAAEFKSPKPLGELGLGV